MRITLCGSARFEAEFIKANEDLSLSGHVVYSLAVYPRDKAGQKDWYSEGEKVTLDAVHKKKILNSDAIWVIAPNDYIGDSTRSEIQFAHRHGKLLMGNLKAISNVLGDGQLMKAFVRGTD